MIELITVQVAVNEPYEAIKSYFPLVERSDILNEATPFEFVIPEYNEV